MATSPTPSRRYSWAWLFGAFLAGSLITYLIGQPESTSSTFGEAEKISQPLSAPKSSSSWSRPEAFFRPRSSGSAPPTEPNNDNEGTSYIPEEWEPQLMGVLIDTNQSMDRRNQRLIELATVSANRVPQVQHECLRHLAFGLSSNDGALFLNLATNPILPVGMRAEFLKQSLGMRPAQLGEWLSRQLSTHHEQEISAMAREYLLEVSDKN